MFEVLYIRENIGSRLDYMFSDPTVAVQHSLCKVSF